MTKVLVIVGTRPEAIKLVPVIQALERTGGQLQLQICNTAQHRELVDSVFEQFDVKADFDLNVMSEAQNPTQVTARVMAKLDELLAQHKFDWMVVQGDTCTVSAASLSGFYHQVKVAHVEAGLRSYDRHNPFPEEINRRITSVIADRHYAPTQAAVDNLISEGIPENRILLTGNSVVDSQLLALSKSPPNRLLRYLDEQKAEHKIILVTAHRRENRGPNLETICRGLKRLLKQFGHEIQIIFPVHPSPSIQRVVKQQLGHINGIKLIEPLDYVSMIHLLKKCWCLITDSGGLQEEAPSLGVPTLVLRDTTERPEGVQAGSATLVGANIARLVSTFSRLMSDHQYYTRMSMVRHLYGDGTTSKRIAEDLLKTEDVAT